MPPGVKPSPKYETTSVVPYYPIKLKLQLMLNGNHQAMFHQIHMYPSNQDSHTSPQSSLSHQLLHTSHTTRSTQLITPPQLQLPLLQLLPTPRPLRQQLLPT